jgi:hypothetical protein
MSKGLDGIGKACLEANRDNLRKQGVDPSQIPGMPVDPARLKKIEAKAEREMQTQLEGWLHIQGWHRRSPGDIKEEAPPRGWQIHLHETQRNPILLDILLLCNDGRHLEFELKTPEGKWSSEEQRILCVCHDHEVFRSVQEAIDYISEWQDDWALPMIRREVRQI